MALIGEAELGSPIAQETLKAVPEMVLELEDIRSPPEKRLQFLMWASGADFECFEDALQSDPTLDGYRQLADVDDRRLYRLTLTEEGEKSSTYLDAAAVDIVILELTVTAGKMRAVARFPSREELREYAEVCQQLGVSFKLERLYEEEAARTHDGGGRGFGLTAPQREALLCALEMGYFDVPRETSLSEMADELDISGQALSTLLRRGQTNLIEHALA